jgi:hypothetical protein
MIMFGDYPIVFSLPRYETDAAAPRRRRIPINEFDYHD